MATTRSVGNYKENELPQDRRTKNSRQIPVEVKRPALQSIADNAKYQAFKKTFNKPSSKPLQDTTNHQPVCNRTAVVPVKPSKTGFAIFQDFETKETAKTSVNETYVLDSRVESPVQASVLEKDSYEDSPMVLDESLTESKSICNEEEYYCTEYDMDIYLYLKNIQTKFIAKPGYMRKQPDINSSMRAVLVDWMVDVGDSYKMQTETVYLAVSFVDRFLSAMSVLRSKLQLVGTACLFIASKYEEIYPPELKDFVYVTDDTYTKKQVLRMEGLILKTLDFDLSTPTSFSFLERYCVVCNIPEEVTSLAKYICELSLLDAEPFLTFLPSEIAAASLCLANLMMNRNPWDNKYEIKSGYVFHDLNNCVQSLYQRYSTIMESPYRAVTEKYKTKKFHYVAAMTFPKIFAFNQKLSENMKKIW